MKKLLNLFKRLRGYFPSRLPLGASEFESWSDSFFDIYSLPTEDRDSIKFALASIIMHLGPQIAYRSKYYFYLTIIAGAAKQVAGAAFYDIKQKQQAAAAAKEVKSEPVQV